MLDVYFGSADLYFGLIAPGACAERTKAVLGAADGAMVYAARPAGLPTGTTVSAWAKGTDAVVQACNLTGGEITIGSLYYRIYVMR